ncbi:MAG: oligosaccharide flippase family protein [Acidimicrobiia bacterium]
MRLWSRRPSGANLFMLGTGQLDAGFAALAGFIAGAVAVRYLTPDQLGVYSLLFLAFSVATQLPTQLMFSPSEVTMAHLPVEERLGSLRWSLPRGLLVSGLASVTVAAGALPLAQDVDLASVTPLLVTAVTFAFASPVQDHIRRVLHTADRSGQASTVSLTNLICTSLAVLALLQVDPLWVPFGAMTIGNIVSSLMALFFVAGQRGSPSPKTRELFSMGRYLLVVGLANSGGGYLAGTLVGAIVGPAALGYVEAARLVARPAEVSATGVLASVGPRLMVASARREPERVKKLSRTYNGTVIGVGVVYGLLVATPLGWGITKSLFPTAYTVGGLVLVTLIAQLVVSLTRPLQARLMGLRREVSLASVEIAAQACRLVASLSAFWIGSFALPVSDFVGNGFKLARYREKLRDQ